MGVYGIYDFGAMARMDPTAAKYIGAGLAAIGMGAYAHGGGPIFGPIRARAQRNPAPTPPPLADESLGILRQERLGNRVST